MHNEYSNCEPVCLEMKLSPELIGGPAETIYFVLFPDPPHWWCLSACTAKLGHKMNVELFTSEWF